MDDEEKLYWIKIITGASCGLLSVFIVPQYLVADGVPVGWFRFLWLLGTWLGLPFPLVFTCLRAGFLGFSDKDKSKREHLVRTGGEIPRFNLKEAFTKFGGWKYTLKTGVGAFFFMFLLTSTVVFTLLYPA